MKASFWLTRWKTNNTPFHEHKANPALVKHFKKLKLAKGSRVFLPLCGKTLDIGWLLAHGYSVAGAELSPLAIEQLFAELGVKPKVAKRGKLVHYHARNLDIFVGNIFDLTPRRLGPIEAVYDRAALIALPPLTRRRYVRHLRELVGTVPQLLVSVDYDARLMDGPPFSVPPQEVERHYAATHELARMSYKKVPGGLRGKVPAKEGVWVLTRREALGVGRRRQDRTSI